MLSGTRDRFVLIRRGVAALFLCAAVVASGLLPSEHVHEADPDHDAPIAHRHFDAHHHDAATIDHDEGHVVWLVDAWFGQQSTQVSTPATVAVAWVFPLEASAGWSSAGSQTFKFPHGPPGSPPGLRAPPHSV